MAAVPSDPAHPPPRRTLALPVDGGHLLQVRTFGHADGLPAVVLHGGPGSGASPLLWRHFDLLRYHVIVPDQRGAGGSRPRGCVDDNRTPDLLADLRTLRRALGVDRWLVVGGSWGATLALAHALDAPDAVAGLLLRAVFLARAEDIDGFFDGAPASLADLHDALHGDAAPRRAEAARVWWHWEQALAGTAGRGPEPEGEALAALVDRYRVQSHYLRHGCWMDDPPLLQRAAGLPPVPTLILHADNDAVCHPDGARALAAVVPHARLRWVAGGGHDPAHPAMQSAMALALDRFAAHRDFELPQGIPA